MKILVFTLRYPPYVAGGYELLTRDAVEALEKRGHTLRVLAGEGTRFAGAERVLPWLKPGLDAEDPWQAALRASTGERFLLHCFRPANYRAALRALRAMDPDVCLFFNMGLVSLGPILAARHAGVPTLGFVADPWPNNHWLSAWRADERAARSKAARLAFLERAWSTLRDAVELGALLTPSSWLRDELARGGLDPETIEVLPLGLPPDMEVAGPVEPRERALGEPLRIVCASSLWKGKGQDVLLAGVARARAGGAELSLVLAGGGAPEYRGELETACAQLGLRGSVRFAGVLSRSALAELFDQSHVLAVPSTWGEPFGLVTLEGMARGLTVVVSDAGASPELVQSGRSGLVVRAGDDASWGGALVRLARNDDYRRDLARAGNALVRERYAYEDFVAGLERALETCTGVRGPSDPQSCGASTRSRA